MSRGETRIEAYLARVAAALPGSGVARAEALDELRDHLREGINEARAAGLDDDAAVDTALSRLGSPSEIAAAFAERPRAVVLALAGYAYIAILVGAALATIGVSGLVAAPLGLLFGSEFIAGHPPVEPLGLERCADLARYHPEASDCAAAWGEHFFEESVALRVVPGLASVVMVAAHLLLLHRLGLSGRWAARPARVAALLSLVASTGAAALLVGATLFAIRDPQALDGALSSVGGPPSAGTGWWVSGSAGALAAVAVSAAATRALFQVRAAPE